MIKYTSPILYSIIIFVLSFVIFSYKSYSFENKINQNQKKFIPLDHDNPYNFNYLELEKVPGESLHDKTSAFKYNELQIQKQNTTNNVNTDFDIQKIDYQNIDNLQKLAESGNSNAQFRIGELEILNGSRNSYNSGLKWLDKAAQQGHFYAKIELFIAYNGIFQGKINWDFDRDKFMYTLIKKSQQSPVAQNYLGLIYHKGISTLKDTESAFKLFNKSAQNNFARAQMNLAVCYEVNGGGSHNFKKAVFWYQKSAEQNFSPAQNNLGVCYAEGIGIAKDISKAKYWLKKAAENGNKFAQFNIKIMTEIDEDIFVDLSKSIYLRHSFL